jgi:nucleotide-binding universal stress UspA family protein
LSSTASVSTAHGLVVRADGSESSFLALEFAATEARVRSLPLEVVNTWECLTTYGGTYPDIDIASDARRVLDETVKSVLGEGSALSITPTAVQGNAALVLVERSHDAVPLVVGSGGHGGFAGLLLGSVSQLLATHAECPIVIVDARQ